MILDMQVKQIVCREKSTKKQTNNTEERPEVLLQRPDSSTTVFPVPSLVARHRPSMLSDRLIFLLLLAASLFPTAQSFHPVLKSATTTSQPLLLCHHRLTALAMSQSHQDTKTDDAVEQCPHPFSELPGDPSLLLVTNLDLGDKKLDIMKGISKAMAEATGKPESYIGVSITHNASVSCDVCECANLREWNDGQGSVTKVQYFVLWLIFLYL